MKKNTIVLLTIMMCSVLLPMNFWVSNVAAASPELDWGISVGDEYTFNVKETLDYTVDDSVFTALDDMMGDMMSEDVDIKANLELAQGFINRDTDIKTKITAIASADEILEYINASVEMRDAGEQSFLNYRDYLVREYGEYIDAYAEMISLFYGNATTVAEMKEAMEDQMDAMPASNFPIERFMLLTDGPTGLPDPLGIPTTGLAGGMMAPYFIPQDYSFSDFYAYGEQVMESLVTPYPIAAAGTEDSYEENDDFASAKSLTVGQTYNLMALDDDWFKFTVPANKLFTVTVTPDASGEVDLKVYDEDEFMLDYSSNTGTIDSVSIVTKSAHTIYVEIKHWSDADYVLMTSMTDYSSEVPTIAEFLEVYGVSNIYVDDKAIGLVASVDYKSLTSSDIFYSYLNSIHEMGFENPKINVWMALEYSEQGVLNTEAIYIDFSCTLDFKEASSGELDIENQPLSVSFSVTTKRDGAPYDVPSKENIEKNEIGENAKARKKLIPGFPISALFFVSLIFVIVSVKKYSKKLD